MSYVHNLYVKKREKIQKYGTLFIAVSDFIRNKLIEQGYPPNKVIKHYIGVDVEFFLLIFIITENLSYYL